jgi:hypothetical protein
MFIVVFKCVQKKQNYAYTHLLYDSVPYLFSNNKENKLMTLKQSTQTEMVASIVRIANASEMQRAAPPKSF